MNLFKVEEKTVPEKYRQTLARMVCISESRMPYKKISKGQYKLYCPHCQTYIDMNWEELKKLQASKTREREYSPETIACPKCNTKYDGTSRFTNKSYDDYISLLIDGEDVGYHVAAEWNFGEPIKLISLDQMAVFKEHDTYIKRGYAIGALGKKIVYNPDYDNGLYRKAVSQRYGWHFLDYYNNWTWVFGSREDKKKYMADMFSISKSNQTTLVLKNNIDRYEALAIHVFDINNMEDFEKHYEYIKSNSAHLREWKDKTLNVYYLDYLDRNKIDLGEYFAYYENLKKLGFKLDKPTDFKHRFDTVEDMVKSTEDERADAKIKIRFDSLPKYSKDNVLIYPFHRASEIRRCGKSLHNCIGGYVNRFADGDTDIYRVDMDAKLTAALEVHDNKLMQAYQDQNSKCSEDIMKHIKSFCKMNGFSLGRYA